MQPFEGLTGPITFDSKGSRTNYTIDILRASSNMPLTKVLIIVNCVFIFTYTFTLNKRNCTDTRKPKCELNLK